MVGGVFNVAKPNTSKLLFGVVALSRSECSHRYDTRFVTKARSGSALVSQRAGHLSLAPSKLGDLL